MVNLEITYKGELVKSLNRSLVERQGLDQDRIDVIKALHIEMIQLFEKAENTDDVNELREIAFSVENVEFMMQEAWGFEKNRNYHTHWFKIPKCDCPYFDNLDNVGTEYRIINDDCLIHGRK